MHTVKSFQHIRVFYYNMVFQREIRTELPFVEPSCDFSEVEQNARSYQKQMKSYHDQKNHVKEHQFAVGNIVYLARNIALMASSMLGLVQSNM